MSSSKSLVDERVQGVEFANGHLSVSMKDGRVIAVPLTWYPRLLNASVEQRRNWRVSGGGYGIHWPDLDEDLSTEGLLQGVAAPGVRPTSEFGLGRLDGAHLFDAGRPRPVQSSALDAASEAIEQTA